ncbi:phage virion morphogenesis protein [Paenirhodobacter populi]|uniref:Phage virion morphogenesis protein n=1 Tax=Paenirhodobacter populi TaxID=2306993 RepID=A0A443J1B0_9RHOB|nr:phage virion morphogenesis protein [Sinirhodobacter populi]RWR14247.1 phage virion morphogenesis protein [Sinirhodobacter populi]
MAGIIIHAELHDEEAQTALQAILDRMANRRPFFAAVGERMLASAQDRFRSQTAPDGTPWVSLRPATIRARTRKGQLPLTILRSNSKGKIGSSLAGSIHYIASEDDVQLGSPLPYAGIHQQGGTINRSAREAKIYRRRDENGLGRRFVGKDRANVVTDVTIPAYSITIPARPYLGLTGADEEGILEDAEDWLMR